MCLSTTHIMFAFLVSAFYAECPNKRVSMNSHIWTKSKFYGMSIGVVNVGEGMLSVCL